MDNKTVNNVDLPLPNTIDKKGIISDLWEDYLDSTATALPALEAAALKLENGEDVDSNTADIKRILHSVKGESGMVGIQAIHDVCHQVESALERLSDSLESADLVIKAKDWMTSVIDFINNNDNQEAAPIQVAVGKKAAINEGLTALKRTALIVDDAVVCRKRIKMILQNHFICSFATNGKEGYEAYVKSLEQGRPYDLITLDINMPEMNGHDTIEAIRKYESEHGIKGLDSVKIIMTTSQGGSGHVMQAFRKGCEAYVIKSGMGEKLLDEIGKLGLLRIKDYMHTTDLPFMPCDMPINEAVKKIISAKSDSFLVLDKSKHLVGMFFERDALMYLTNCKETSGTVEDFMTKELVCFDQENSINDVVWAHLANGFRKIPITHEDKLVGVISGNNLISYIMEMRKENEKKTQ